MDYQVGQITILNYEFHWKPKWVKIKSIISNNTLAIVHMWNGNEWIIHPHYTVDIRNLGERDNLPEELKPFE